MKRRRIGSAATAIAVVGLAVLYAQKEVRGYAVGLDWADKSSLEQPPTAVLIEFGHQDTAPTDWSGDVSAVDAKTVHREHSGHRPQTWRRQCA